MKISVITITCRENPRLEDMARSLAGSLGRAKGVELEWIIVDERKRDFSFKGLTIKVVVPLSSPHRESQDKAPAHNSARNAGLFAAKGDYVVFLNDCAVVTRGWVELVTDMAKEGLGMRCKAFAAHDMAIPADGVITYRDHHDRLRPVPPTTVAGVCWGAPARAFDKIHGFDLGYDGEDKGHDLDAIIRLSRTGLQFASSERAFVIRLTRTATKNEISTRREVFNGARNKQLVGGTLSADRDRILPLVEARAPRVAPPAAVAPAPAPTPVTRPAAADRVDNATPPVPAPVKVAEPAPKATE